jgi:hypothetical protein
MVWGMADNNTFVGNFINMLALEKKHTYEPFRDRCERLLRNTDGWVPVPDGDGCGWMANPVSQDDPDWFWEVIDCEGDILCICQKESAIWLCMILNHFGDQIEINGDRTGYCKKIADGMILGRGGMGGTWREFVKANSFPA